MIRKAMLATAALAILTLNVAPAHAAPCRDAKGKFTKCHVEKKPTKCRDAKGKFTKCDTAAPAAPPAQ